tara:strand:- start:13723 stop:14031 length:309 start_codon:yes stop_codon:yes gene_type:complete
MPELDGKKFSYDKEGKKDFMEALREKRAKDSAKEKTARKAAETNKKKGRTDSASPEKTDPKPKRKYKRPSTRKKGGMMMPKRSPKIERGLLVRKYTKKKKAY